MQRVSAVSIASVLRRLEERERPVHLAEHTKERMRMKASSVLRMQQYHNSTNTTLG